MLHIDVEIYEGLKMTIAATWKKYSEITVRMSEQLGRSKNIVGEYAEYLMNKHLDGKLLELSNKSADIEKDGKLYQVKARKIERGMTTQLSVIRSWEFDYLAVIIFDVEGNVKRAVIVPAAVAKEVSAENNHQNGCVITTSRNFFECRSYTDITDDIKKLNGETVLPKAEVLEIRSREFIKLGKIQNWADYPEQNNHRVIKAFLKLQQTEYVTKSALKELCSKPIEEPALFVNKFSQNYNSMKTDAGNSHGKVFIEDDGLVFVYPQAMAEIEKYFY